MRVKTKELYGRLDPSIRHQIQKRGIGIKENIYIGFDTEFTISNAKENKMVSAQLAITTKSYVQIPKVYKYTISTIDEKTNSIIKISKNSNTFNYTKLEMSIQKNIELIRMLKYEKYDYGMEIITECLKLIKGLSYIDKDDYTVFTLPRSVIQPYIQFGDSFSLEEMLKIATSIAKPYIDESNNQLMLLIRGIASNKFRLEEGKDRLLLDIREKYKDFESIDEIGKDFDKPLPLKNKEELLHVLAEKRLTRKFLVDLFSPKTSVTKTRGYYIIAHLTQADLSLLRDFSEVKEELSIVNGSFVTLGKPINFRGQSIHVRDTMLLAPGGSKSLASIGYLYNKEFNKIKINKEDLEDMQGFLIRDKAKFTEYALRDSLISLIHAA